MTPTISETVFTDLFGVANGRFVTTASFNYLGSNLRRTSKSLGALDCITELTLAA